MRTLLIVDNLEIAMMLSAILTSHGHEVSTALSGSSGLTQAKALLPNAIISDLRLPDVSGYDIARQLRSEARFKHTPMIAVGGSPLQADMEKALQAGFNHLLLKPYTAAQILALLNPAK